MSYIDLVTVVFWFYRGCIGFTLFVCVCVCVCVREREREGGTGPGDEFSSWRAGG